MWTLVRFLHLLAALTWVGSQVTLFLLFPVLRRRLEPEAFREVARAAGMRLALIAAVSLPLALVTGISLARHEVPSAHDGLVTAKLVLWVLIVAAFGLHGATAARNRRVWLSAAMLALSLAAVAVGARLAEVA
jgi:uncharacterized membrane protein